MQAIINNKTYTLFAEKNNNKTIIKGISKDKEIIKITEVKTNE